MNWKIEENHLKELCGFCPTFSFNLSYAGEVLPIESLPIHDILKGILEGNFKYKEIVDVGFYGFKNVGMHVDDIFDLGFKTLAIFVDGYGSLQYFKNKEKYKNIEIMNLSVKPGSAVIFDQMLPHSFSLSFEETGCVALLAGIK